MPDRVSGFTLGLMALVFALTLSSRAIAIDAADEAAIQSVIERQISAFQADDGATAYGFAAPAIKRLFPTADAFMSMVRQGYQPVYRPRDYSFKRARSSASALVQEVDIVGPQGGFWTAIYTLEKQDDGSWKITGVRLFQAKGAEA